MRRLAFFVFLAASLVQAAEVEVPTTSKKEPPRRAEPVTPSAVVVASNTVQVIVPRDEMAVRDMEAPTKKAAPAPEPARAQPAKKIADTPPAKAPVVAITPAKRAAPAKDHGSAREEDN